AGARSPARTAMSASMARPSSRVAIQARPPQVATEAVRIAIFRMVCRPSLFRRGEGMGSSSLGSGLGVLAAAEPGERGEEERHEGQRRAGAEHEPADHGTAERRVLL